MRHFAARAVLAAVLSFAAAPAFAAPLRPEVGKPLARAESLSNAGNYTGALAQIRLAQNARGLTAEETFTIEQTLASVAGRACDYARASKAYADLLNSGRASGGLQLTLLKAEASLAFNAKNYPDAIQWIQRYLRAVPNDAEMRSQLITAYYLNKDYVNAAKLQAAQVAATIRAGGKPKEEQLQLLAACQRANGDTLGFGNTMVQLVTFYPKPDYWENLIHAAQTRPGFSDRLTFDIDRFEFALGLVKNPDDYMEMTELALQVPVPGEAKQIIDQGYATGVLGTGPGAPRQQRLRDLVEKTLASEKAALPGREADAQSAHDGNALVALGEEYASYGDYPKGISMIIAGIRKGELRHPDDAKLHLGIAYMRAGNKAQAIRTFRSVGGTEGAAEIARLWTLRLASAK